MQGCLKRENINVTEVKQFMTDIKREYKEIKSIKVYHVPTEIQYNYKLTKNLGEDKYSAILKKTIELDNILKKIDEYSKQGFSISFRFDNKYIEFVPSKDNPNTWIMVDDKLNEITTITLDIN